MNRRKMWILGGAALVAVWGLALGGMAWARSRAATPEKVAAFVQEHPLADLSPQQRQTVIRDLAGQVNRLTFEQRQQLRGERTLWRAFDLMTDEEKRLYLDLTLSKGMKEMMKAFNDMPKEKRQALVDDAVTRMKRDNERFSREEMKRRLSDENTQRVVNEGLRAFMSDASAASKIDLQPLIEQMQKMLQGER